MLVLGVGQRSCGKFIAAVGPIGATKQHKSADGTKYHAELIRYHEWMMGFVSVLILPRGQHRLPDQRRHLGVGCLDAEVVQ